MKRYDIEMYGDDMIEQECEDGRWVEYEDAAAEIARLNAERDEEYTAVRMVDTLADRAATAEHEVARLRAVLTDLGIELVDE